MGIKIKMKKIVFSALIGQISAEKFLEGGDDLWQDWKSYGDLIHGPSTFSELP